MYIQQIKHQNSVLNFAKFIIISILVFGIIYTTLNINAVFSKLNFVWTSKITHQDLSDKVLPAGTKMSQLPQIADSQQKASEVGFLDNRLIIPKLGINVPIIWDIPEKQVINSLVRGTIHYQGTAHPGKVGNVFIMGHSSYYSWVKSDYKTVFANLSALQSGDQIIITYNDKVYLYQTVVKKVVKPQDVSVMDQGQDKKLSLMTCVPIGTAQNRLIVEAKQINPPE